MFAITTTYSYHVYLCLCFCCTALTGRPAGMLRVFVNALYMYIIIRHPEHIAPPTQTGKKTTTETPQHSGTNMRFQLNSVDIKYIRSLRFRLVWFSVQYDYITYIHIFIMMLKTAHTATALDIFSCSCFCLHSVISFFVSNLLVDVNHYIDACRKRVYQHYICYWLGYSSVSMYLCLEGVWCRLLGEKYTS